ncbi:GDSL-type esterase/lipase family protein [Streptomyces sp. NPDC127074]|uniref:GDSL-type esterase/lipase family protein n=1 Tax=Streptomyces sp. NPDC127074 TaxID=3347130 RepID=UPI003647D00F
MIRRMPALRARTWAALLSAALLTVFAASGGPAAGASGHPPRQHWVGGWAAAAGPPGTSGPSATGFTDRTLRLVVHVGAGGSALRIRLSNEYGTTPLDIGAATVATRGAGAAAAPGTRHTVTFGGRPATTVPAGARTVSDPVGLNTKPDTDLLVSLHLPGPTGPATYHGWAKQTSYVSTAGDHTADDTAAAYPTTTTSWFYLQGVDVSTRDAGGTVVAFGDSITEGGLTANDSNRRWTDDLSRRLVKLPRGHRPTVVNAGIGGNRVLTPGGYNGSGSINLGDSAQARFGRDALEQPGVRAVIFLEGTNDLGGLHGPHPGEQLTAAHLTAGISALAARAHAAGLRFHCGTITPNGKLGDVGEKIREQVNTWLRGTSVCDGVIDFDHALRDPADPHHLLPAYDAGDGVHPTDAGLKAMADTVDLRLLTGDVS